MSKDYIDILNRIKAKRRIRGLIVSYNCNLNCVYCYIQDKAFIHPSLVNLPKENHGECKHLSLKGKTMPIEIAKSAIEDIFKDENTEGYEEIEIDFVGAEPLTVFNNLKEISEWFWSKEWTKPHILFATTNGTLLNSEMKEWFYKNRKYFVLGLSCDGEASTQDKNRSQSTGSIDFKFFLNTWPTQPVKMTISEDRVANLADDVIYLHKRGFNINANPANGMKSWNENNITEYGKQLLRLMEYYLKNPKKIPSSLFTVGLEGVLASFERKGSKYCGAGEGYDVVDVDGKKYPCHMFSPLVLEERKLQLVDKINFNSKDSFEDKMCKSCILKKICPSCYGLNFKQYGDPSVHDKTLCKLFIIQALVNCKFYLKLFSKKKNLSLREQKILEAVKLIYHYFYSVEKIKVDHY